MATAVTIGVRAANNAIPTACSCRMKFSIVELTPDAFDNVTRPSHDEEDDGQAKLCRAPGTIRLRSDPVHRNRRCTLRAASDVRQRGRPRRGRAAAAVRGAGALHARCPLPALAPNRAGLRSRQRQARLLHVPGIPDRPVAGQQRPEPAPRPCRPVDRRRSENRLDGPARGGTRRRPRQRRSRPPRRLLSRFDGDDAASGDGLRTALRVRHFPADHRGRLAT